MKLKIFLFIFFIFTFSFLLISCGNNEIEEFKVFEKKAIEYCDNRNGEIIFFGIVLNSDTLDFEYRSVCYKFDERHFYYDVIT